MNHEVMFHIAPHLQHGSSLPFDADFPDAPSLLDLLAGEGYQADAHIAGVVSLAVRLRKPILVEGPAGTGKTQLAKTVATLAGRELVRLQCYEGLDESKALYEWDYRKQLLWIQAARAGDPADPARALDIVDGIFDERFLLARPLLEAIRSASPVVLLVDEVDRIDAETEALFLEVLAEHQVSIPEFGRISARHVPLVFLTSNGTRDLSEALKRRCLFLYLDYPSPERERAIVAAQVPQLSPAITAQLVGLVGALRRMGLRKAPSISETIDFAQTLVLLESSELDRATAVGGLHILLKHQDDIRAAAGALPD